MFDFHQDHTTYISFQYRTAREHIIPFLELPQRSLRVLEIGCGQGGVLQAFLERGDRCVGIDLNPGFLAEAEKHFADEIAAGRIDFIERNIYDIDPARDFDALFDVIVLKDVIEHIPEQARFMAKLRDFMAPGAKVFFGFPPWQMPFGGHQQIARGKWLGKLPYIHLLPQSLYRGLIRAGGEPASVEKELLACKATGISLERFERIVRDTGLRITKKQHWLLNPIYEYKFGLRARQQFGVVSALPYLRNFLTTCGYYVIE
jgi:SAM-dependent methyltransferase